MTLYFLKGSSGFIKIGRSTNFDKRLSEIRRATTDLNVEVIKVFHGEPELVIDLERQLLKDLADYNFKGEWFHDTAEVRAALVLVDRQFNPENYIVAGSDSISEGLCLDEIPGQSEHNCDGHAEIKSVHDSLY